MGYVGYCLVQYLCNVGVKFFVVDIYLEGVEKVVKVLGVIVVVLEDILSLDVDVLVFCVFGLVINDQILLLIKVKVIVGVVNNQFVREEIGDFLVECGIFYVFDYVINVGGIIDIYYQCMGVSSNNVLKIYIEEIGVMLKLIYQWVEQENCVMSCVVNVMVEE